MTARDLTPHIDFKRILHVTGVVTIVLFILVHLAGSWLYVATILNSGCVGAFESLEGYGFPSIEVEVVSRDNIVLNGWYSEGGVYPETAVIVMPGLSGNTFAAIPDALIIAEAGYSTLILEHRTCADDSLQMTTGYREALDMLGGVDYLLARPDIEHIAVFGYSVGGNAALSATAQEPAIEAAIAAGAYSSLADDILDPEIQHDPYNWFWRRLIYLAFWAQLGENPAAIAPGAGLLNSDSRPILLIYGEAEQASGQRIREAVGPTVDLWVIRGAGHGGYQLVEPSAYPARIREFLSNAFPMTE